MDGYNMLSIYGTLIIVIIYRIYNIISYREINNPLLKSICSFGKYAVSQSLAHHLVHPLSYMINILYLIDMMHKEISH